MVDDILDITATTEELGKTAGKDLASEKTTYPSLVGLERSREVCPQARAEMPAALGQAAPGWALHGARALHLGLHAVLGAANLGA